MATRPRQSGQSGPFTGPDHEAHTGVPDTGDVVDPNAPDPNPPVVTDPSDPSFVDPAEVE